jgi:hypothetical protein
VETLETIDWGQVARDQAALARGHFARFRDAALGGKDHYAAERNLLAEVAKAVPDVAELFKAGERLRVDAVRRLALSARLIQWIHCSPGYPRFGTETHELVRWPRTRHTVLYVSDDPKVAIHSKALRTVNNRVRAIQADIYRPREIRDHPEVQGFLDWSQPIVLIHGDAWIHYPGTAEQAAEIMQQWVAELVNGSYTVSSHLLRPEPAAAAARACHLEQLVSSSAVNSIRFRTRAEIQGLFSGQKLARGLIDDQGRDPGTAPDIDSAALQPWVVGGVGQVTSSTPPRSPAGSVGIPAAAQILGLTEAHVRELAGAGRIPSTTGPGRRWEFQPAQLREISDSWTRMEEKGLTPPVRRAHRRQANRTADVD